MVEPSLTQDDRTPVQVRSRWAVEMREDPMSATVDGAQDGRDGHQFDARDTPRPSDGAWRVWEQLRAWDRRYAFVVDATLVAALFVICSGWFAFSRVSHPDLWFVAGLTLPLVLRRR